MSERVLVAATDAPWTLGLIMDDLVPLKCTGLHAANQSVQAVYFACVLFGAWNLSPQSDQTITFGAPIIVQATVAQNGAAGWRVPGVSDGFLIAYGPKGSIAQKVTDEGQVFPVSLLPVVPKAVSIG